MTEGPLVSVIATCYNHSRFVVECFESIQAQTYPNIEFIIMDDHSTDGSVEIIEDWIRTTGVTATFLPSDENRGICRVRNHALKHCNGTYLAMVSTDDAWLPDKLERHVKEMEAQPADVAVLYTDAYRMDESGAPIPEMFIEPYLPDIHPPPSGDIYEFLLDGNFIPSLTTLVRRARLVDVGPYDESLSFEDWDMWLRIAQRFKFFYHDVPSARYRVVSTSLDHALRGSRRAGLDASKIRIQLKHLGYAPAFDRLLGWRSLQYARSLYQREHPRRDEIVGEVAQAGKDHRIRWLSLVATWAVPHRPVWWLADKVEQAAERVRPLVSRARRVAGKVFRRARGAP